MNAEAEVNVERVAEAVAKILANGSTQETLHSPHGTPNAPEARKRKQRSDAGKPKPPKPPAAAPGRLTQQQWARINVLADTRENAARTKDHAEEAYRRACAEFTDYLDSLTTT